MKVVYQGRGGFVELEDCRYDIEHVDAGHFCIHFRSSICFEKRHEHLAQLMEFAQTRQPQWYVEVPSNFQLGNMNEVWLRVGVQEDRDLIFASYKATLQNYVEWAWGWNEEFQTAGFWKHHPVEQFRVVMVGQKFAGAMHVEEQETLHFVRMIFLLPEFQGRGIGSRLLGEEVARVRKSGKQLHLKVIKINPAKNLYERLGFSVIEEDKVTYHMRLSQPGIRAGI
jgi:ribosomal protein S18 acetylase RimI-like enzyme